MKLTLKQKQQRKVRRDWVKALRSGKYAQGRYRLHTIKGDKHSFCCLGVLCDLAVKAKVLKSYVRGSYVVYGPHEQYSVLPDELLKFAGILSNQGKYIPSTGRPTSLVANNDGRGRSHKDFNQIADIIESEPIGLFKEGV